MRKIFALVAPIVWFGDEIVRRVVYWAAFIVLVSAPMSWVASYIAPIAQYGWGAVVFAGVGAACAITLVICGALVAWRYLHPLPKQPKEESKTYVGEINIAVGLPPSTEPVLLIGYATCNEARLRIVVEYSYLVVELGFVGWQSRMLVELANLIDVIKCQKIVIPIVTASLHEARLMWGKPNGQLVNSIQKGKYRARIRFIGIDSEQVPKYFLLTALADSDPNLISVTLDCDFTFINEWENWSWQE